MFLGPLLVAPSVGVLFVDQNVAGSNPSQDAYGKQPINVSLSLPLSQINGNKSLGWNLKNK